MYVYVCERERGGRDREVGWLFGWLVVFYGMSTLVDCLMPNHIYAYILNK